MSFHPPPIPQSASPETEPARLPRPGAPTPVHPLKAADPAGVDHTLVVVFLRGGADGLHMVIPCGEQAYYRQRPTLHIPAPDDVRAPREQRALDLDGFFGLHPALAPLLPLWQAGRLACVQACGAPDESRSHFKAMELIERGLSQETGPSSGWLGRYLALSSPQHPSPLRAAALGEQTPRSLYGSVPAAALRSLGDFQLGQGPGAAAYRDALAALYSGADSLSQRGRDTLQMLETIRQITDQGPSRGETAYPESEFGRSLQDLSRLIKAEIGLEVAALDINGWDTHFAQGVLQGHMPGLMADLSAGLAAFTEDLSDQLKHLTILVMSEFGRRAYENASLGTDHGRGGLLMVIGEGIAGGQVLGSWPGLEQDQLIGPGDLAVTTDYRDVLAAVLQRRLGCRQIETVFPAYQPAEIALFQKDPS